MQNQNYSYMKIHVINTCDYKKQMKHNETQFQNLLKLLNWPLLNITQLLTR
jgi:hypothetical protein